jgi:dynein light chain 4
MVKSSDKINIDDEEFQKCIKKPLVKYSDMPTEMGNEAVEVCDMALDKFQSSRDWEGASVLIKNTLDKKFGQSWQCAVGEGFGFDMSCQQKYLLHLYYGKVGVLCYKS